MIEPLSRLPEQALFADRTPCEFAFAGDFMPFADPYVQGPVPRTASVEEFIMIRAAFLAGAHYAPSACDILTQDYADLARAKDYARVALWFEHDSHDQLILARLLHYFKDEAHRPEHLQFISVAHFPGVQRFNGIGQLPPQAMRVLWSEFAEVAPNHLELGHAAWEAITAPSPEALRHLVEGGTKAIPTMATALRRHLQELPSAQNGLSLTQHPDFADSAGNLMQNATPAAAAVSHRLPTAALQSTQSPSCIYLPELQKHSYRPISRP